MTRWQGVLRKGKQYQSRQHDIIPQTAYDRTGRADSGQMKHCVLRLLSRMAAVHAIKEYKFLKDPGGQPYKRSVEYPVTTSLKYLPCGTD